MKILPAADTPVDPGGGRSWYSTALTAAAVAGLALLGAGHRPAFGLAALALAATAIVAVIEGARRGRGRPPSPVAGWTVGVLTFVAALLCLLGVIGLRL